ncbi:MAG: hypothetical protein OXG56_05260 [Gammaproteobacteria bacterium]|nr:hypothetical protein [Gammaproteobacteria bacterium]
MTPDRIPAGPTWPERTVVLDPPVPLWILTGLWATIAWIVFASLVLALRRLRRGDGSAFRSGGPPPRADEHLDWDTRTGSFAWMNDWEERLRHDDDSRH